MKLFGALGLALFVFAQPATAQVTNVVVDPLTAKVDFASADHSTVIPAGQVGAGSPTIASYQASVFVLSVDVATGTPIVVGPVVAKTVATASGDVDAPLRLTFAQLGITAMPPCTAVLPALCPQYSVVLVSIGPGGTSARGVASESGPFSRASLLPAVAPVGPSTVNVKP